MIMPFDIDQTDTSWIYLLLFVIFVLTCTRIKGNFKFAGALLRDTVVVRERENLFDVTMRETSFIVLAVLLSACSIGILLWNGVCLIGSRLMIVSYIPGLSLQYCGILIPVGICMAIMSLYMAAMWICYYLVGNVFSDASHARMWVRGFTSSMAFGAFIFFPLALVTLAYPEYSIYTTISGLIMLILVKIVFIVKGFRIFFTESSLWVVFLYYLCSLEIIPLSIVFGLACSLLG